MGMACHDTPPKSGGIRLSRIFAQSGHRDASSGTILRHGSMTLPHNEKHLPSYQAKCRWQTLSSDVMRFIRASPSRSVRTPAHRYAMSHASRGIQRRRAVFRTRFHLQIEEAVQGPVRLDCLFPMSCTSVVSTRLTASYRASQGYSCSLVHVRGTLIDFLYLP